MAFEVLQKIKRHLNSRDIMALLTDHTALDNLTYSIIHSGHKEYTIDQLQNRFLEMFLKRNPNFSQADTGISMQSNDIYYFDNKNLPIGLVTRIDFPNGHEVFPVFNSPKYAASETNHLYTELNKFHEHHTRVSGRKHCVIVPAFTSNDHILNNGGDIPYDIGIKYPIEIPENKGGIGYNLETPNKIALLNSHDLHASSYDCKFGASLSYKIERPVDNYDEAIRLSRQITESNKYLETENKVIMFMFQNKHGVISHIISQSSPEMITKTRTDLTQLQILFANVLYSITEPGVILGTEEHYTSFFTIRDIDYLTTSVAPFRYPLNFVVYI